ncbi:MAG: transposase, partial [Terriglobales bacterium]
MSVNFVFDTRPEVDVIVYRHRADCRFIQKEKDGRCRCPKHIYVRLTRARISAKTKSWETARQRGVGDYRPEHLFTLKQSLEGYRYYQKLILELDQGSELYRIAGVDLTDIPGVSAATAQVILTEIGTDVSRFRNASAFASWLGLCPE